MEQYCSICERNCARERLECKRGRKYFSLTEDHQGNQESKLIALFYKCSHLFMHRNGKNQGKNRILAILSSHGNMTQRELLDHTDIRSASLSELLAKIESNGDIMRERNKENARHVDICLTEKGKQEAEKICREQAELARELFSPLDEEEQKQLELLMVKLLLAWKTDGRNGND